MPKLLQINVSANVGSTGKIAEHIGLLAEQKGWESVLAYGRSNNKSQLKTIKIGSDYDIKCHGIQTRLLDNHGLSSRNATSIFIDWVKSYKPDLVHLHNIHGYYINYPILFKWLKEWNGPVIWTLHDCWPFTGHCAYYSSIKCNKWQTHCYNCPQITSYPASICVDRSKSNFSQKKRFFTNLSNLHIVTVSDWLKNEVAHSFLGNYPLQTIHNGIDLSIFKPGNNNVKDNTTKIILGVANKWEDRKGLNDFIYLRKLLPEKYTIKLVGLSNKQIKTLPNGIIGIERTSDIKQLVELYTSADIYINTSVEETLGMTTIEAMACGTPVIVYDSTACKEPIEPNICRSVSPKDINGLIKAIQLIEDESNNNTAETLIKWVSTRFNESICFQEYINLYEEILHK